MHVIGHCLGICLQFCLGPGKNDQRFLLGIYFIVLLLALQFIYAQAFNHLLFPVLFSHLKLAPGCSKVYVIILEPRLLVSMDWNHHNRVGTPKLDISSVSLKINWLFSHFYHVNQTKSFIFNTSNDIYFMNSTTTNLTSRVNLKHI